MGTTGHKIEARSTNYLLTIGDDKELTMAAQNANIADISLGATLFYSGLKELKLPSNTINLSPFVADIILSEDMAEWLTIFKWMLKCKNTNSSHLEQTKPISLTSLSAHSSPIAEFIYTDAWPMEMSSVQYAINSEGSEVLTTTVTFEYNILTVVTSTGERIDESYTG